MRVRRFRWPKPMPATLTGRWGIAESRCTEEWDSHGRTTFICTTGAPRLPKSLLATRHFIGTGSPAQSSTGGPLRWPLWARPLWARPGTCKSRSRGPHSADVHPRDQPGPRRSWSRSAPGGTAPAAGLRDRAEVVDLQFDGGETACPAKMVVERAAHGHVGKAG